MWFFLELEASHSSSPSHYNQSKSHYCTKQMMREDGWTEEEKEMKEEEEKIESEEEVHYILIVSS